MLKLSKYYYMLSDQRMIAHPPTPAAYQDECPLKLER